MDKEPPRVNGGGTLTVLLLLAAAPPDRSARSRSILPIGRAGGSDRAAAFGPAPLVMLRAGPTHRLVKDRRAGANSGRSARGEPRCEAVLAADAPYYTQRTKNHSMILEIRVSGQEQRTYDRKKSEIRCERMPKLMKYGATELFGPGRPPCTASLIRYKATHASD